MKLKIPLDILDAFTVVFLEKYDVEITRDVFNSALLQYEYRAYPWGPVGIIRLRKLDRKTTDLFFSPPYPVTLRYAIDFVDHATQVLEQRETSSPSGENHPQDFEGLVRMSGQKASHSLNLLYPDFSIPIRKLEEMKMLSFELDPQNVPYGLFLFSVMEYITQKRSSHHQSISVNLFMELIKEHPNAIEPVSIQQNFNKKFTRETNPTVRNEPEPEKPPEPSKPDVPQKKRRKYLEPTVPVGIKRLTFWKVVWDKVQYEWKRGIRSYGELATLVSIDWHLPVSEDTLERIIKAGLAGLLD